MLFSEYPTYDKYRTLWLPPEPAPNLKGYDVYALQTVVNDVCGLTLKLDGWLGGRTSEGIETLQRQVAVPDDRKAGGVTQRAGLLVLLSRLVSVATLPDAAYRLGKGQMEHESSNRWGNYSDKRDDPDADAGWSYDAGACQENTREFPPSHGFTPRLAITNMLARLNHYYARYSDTLKFKGTDHTTRRRWSLAAGAWNAPAWTDWLAGLVTNRPPAFTEANELKLETYIASVTVYL